jgi:hypothetical protein
VRAKYSVWDYFFLLRVSESPKSLCTVHLEILSAEVVAMILWWPPSKVTIIATPAAVEETNALVRQMMVYIGYIFPPGTLPISKKAIVLP